MASAPGEIRWRRLVEECLRREIGAAAPLPGLEQDLIETGVLDSMGWVSFIRALESASGVADLGSALTEGVSSLENIFKVLDAARAQSGSAESGALRGERPSAGNAGLLGRFWFDDWLALNSLRRSRPRLWHDRRKASRACRNRIAGVCGRRRR